MAAAEVGHSALQERRAHVRRHARPHRHAPPRPSLPARRAAPCRTPGRPRAAARTAGPASTQRREAEARSSYCAAAHLDRNVCGRGHDVVPQGVVELPDPRSGGNELPSRVDLSRRGRRRRGASVPTSYVHDADAVMPTLASVPSAAARAAALRSPVATSSVLDVSALRSSNVADAVHSTSGCSPDPRMETLRGSSATLSSASLDDARASAPTFPRTRSRPPRPAAARRASDYPSRTLRRSRAACRPSRRPRPARS